MESCSSWQPSETSPASIQRSPQTNTPSRHKGFYLMWLQALQMPSASHTVACGNAQQPCMEFLNVGLCTLRGWHLQHPHKADTEQLCLFSLCHGWEETIPQYGHVNRWDLLPRKGQRRNYADPRAIKDSEEDVVSSHAYRQLPAGSAF